MFLSDTATVSSVKRSEYVRPSGESFVLESVVTKKQENDSSFYRSVTHRSQVTMDLAIHFDKDRVISANIILKTKEQTSTVSAAFSDKQVKLLRGGKVIQKLPYLTRPILATTAPDWSDIILLMSHYDQRKGGKQSFLGLWFHPNKEAHLRTFVVAKLGEQALKKKTKNIAIGKFRVTLRSGAYLIWADTDGLVYRIRKPDSNKASAVLRGYEKLTADW